MTPLIASLRRPTVAATGQRWPKAAATASIKFVGDSLSRFDSFSLEETFVTPLVAGHPSTRLKHHQIYIPHLYSMPPYYGGTPLEFRKGV